MQKQSQIIDLTEKRKKKKKELSLREKKQKLKKRKKYIIVALVIAALFLILFRQIIGLYLEKRELLNENKNLKESIQEYQRKVEKIDTPEYTEEQAREKLNMVMPGEKIFVFDEKNEKQN